MMTQTEYDYYEARQLRQTLAEVEGASLQDRREARQDYADALTVPDLVPERVQWLLDGTYGYGAYQEARRMLRAHQRNRRYHIVAALSQLVAALEWRCPQAFARQAWQGLTPETQAALTVALRGVVDRALAERDEVAS